MQPSSGREYGISTAPAPWRGCRGEALGCSKAGRQGSPVEVSRPFRGPGEHSFLDGFPGDDFSQPDQQPQRDYIGRDRLASLRMRPDLAGKRQQPLRNLGDRVGCQIFGMDQSSDGGYGWLDFIGIIAEHLDIVTADFNGATLDVPIAEPFVTSFKYQIEAFFTFPKSLFCLHAPLFTRALVEAPSDL